MSEWYKIGFYFLAVLVLLLSLVNLDNINKLERYEEMVLQSNITYPQEIKGCLVIDGYFQQAISSPTEKDMLWNIDMILYGLKRYNLSGNFYHTPHTSFDLLKANLHDLQKYLTNSTDPEALKLYHARIVLKNLRDEFQQACGIKVIYVQYNITSVRQ